MDYKYMEYKYYDAKVAGSAKVVCSARVYGDTWVLKNRR